MKKSELLKFISRLATILIFILCITVISAAADESSLKISKALFVSEASGFGIYEKEENDHFLSGSKTSIYIEIDNFCVRQGEEKFVSDISVRLDVYNEKNEIVFTGEEVFSMKNELKSRRRDLSFKVPLDLSKWKTGKYTLTFVAKDNIRGLEDTASLPLEIF